MQNASREKAFSLYPYSLGDKVTANYKNWIGKF
jgi:hypothetical protein